MLRTVAGAAHPRVISVTGRTGARLSTAEAAAGEDALVKAVTGAGERVTMGRTTAETIVESARTGRLRALVPDTAPLNVHERFFKARK